MNNKKNNLLLSFFFYSGWMSACFTTIINDGKEKILIHNKNDNTVIVIPKKGHRRFGKSTEHAHFSIYMQQPNTHAFSEIYICKQNQCGKKGNIVLRLSDIEHRTDVTRAFTIIEQEPVVPMVQELPMMKKCRRCN